jgi:tetratricopeptide (TPR) repeat protein
MASASADDRGACKTASGDVAIAACTRQVQKDPSDAVSWYNRGIEYENNSDHDRAFADFSQAIRINPNYADAYVNRAAVNNSRHEYDRALADSNDALRLNPKSALAWNNRGLAYDNKREFERAIADYEQALKLDPNNKEARFNRARVELERGQALLAAAARGRAAPPVIQPPAQPAPPPPVTRPAALPQPAAQTQQAQVAPVQPPQQALTAGPALAAVQQPVSPPPQQPAVQIPGQPAKRALVIGIDAYANLGSAAQLQRAVADAEAVGDQLASLGFQVTRLTTARQGTLDSLLHSFDDFRKSVTPGDMVVLFYAGHGMGLSDGTYLVPADVREAGLEVEAMAKRAAINENEFTDGLRRAGAGIVVAVIDACRNDLFSRAAGRSIGNARGLRPVETEGIFKLYSASEGQTALDRLPGSDGSRNSVFTRVFLKALGTPGLNLSTLGTAVRDEVHELARAADHQQTPAVYDKLIGSTRVYFAGNTAAAR